MAESGAAVTTLEAKQRALWIASVAAAAVIAQQVAGKVARDALFLSSFPARLLPYAVAAGAAASLLTVVLLSRLYSHRGPGALLPRLMLLSSSCFLAEWALSSARPGWAAALVYLHTAAFGGATISAFWSVINEVFDPHAARRGIARITTGATVGGLLGGLFAERLAHTFGPGSILLGVALIGPLSAALMGHLGARSGGPMAAEVDGPPLAFGLLLKRPLLRSIAAVVVTVTLLEVLLEYGLNAEAAATFRDPRDLVSFFAAFYSVTGLVTFLVQLGLTQRSLEHLGLSGTLLLRPGLVLLAAVGAAVHPSLVSVALTCGLQVALGNSFFRSAYELLYTPLAPKEKRPLKVVVDVGLARLVSIAGSGLILGLVAWGVASATVLVLLAIACAVGLILIALGLHRRYVEALASSLQAGVIRLAGEEVLDLTTRRTLASTTVALDRDRLLAEIEALRSQSIAAARAEPTSPPGAAGSPPAAAPTFDPTLLQIQALLHTAPAEVRRVLADEHLGGGAIPFVLPHLGSGDPAVVSAASKALRRSLDAQAGLYTDALLDPTRPLLVRRRLAQVLGHSKDTRVVDALLRALDDPDFDLRYLCARALERIRRHQPTVEFAAGVVLTKVRRALDADALTWSARRCLQGEHADRRHGHRGLEQVFHLLALIQDPQVTALCLGAFLGTDERLRGTAAEYLLNVLPAEVSAGILEKVLMPPTLPRPPRSAADAAQDLVASAASIPATPAEPEAL